MKRVDLPLGFDESSIISFMANVICENYEPVDSEITFNLDTLHFIKPVGVVSLRNLVLWLIKKKVVVNFRSNRININSPAINGSKDDPLKYLDDSGFFELFFNKKIFLNSHKRETTIALKDVAVEQYSAWLDSFLDWLVYALNVSDKRGFAGLEMSVAEIFNNIKDHSGENIGCVFAQHYPKRNTVEIAISDFGVGIPAQIRKEYPCKYDALALSIAIKEGTSTRTTPRNRGAGLNVLTDYVVNSKGGVEIISNRGKLTCNTLNQPIPTELLTGCYPGTLILIKLRTDAIFIEPQEEDFSW